MSSGTRKRLFVPFILTGLAAFALCLPAIAADTSTRVAATGTVLDMQRHEPDVSRAVIDLPPRGTTMEEVLARYGQPVKKYPPVGDPPITRWDYPGFSMYFENNLFLHAVVPADPVPLVHKDQLIGSNG